MPYFVIKCALSGIIIAAVSEIAKPSPASGALVVSLPLLSLFSFLQLRRATGDAERIAGVSNRRSGTCCRRYRCS